MKVGQVVNVVKEKLLYLAGLEIDGREGMEAQIGGRDDGSSRALSVNVF